MKHFVAICALLLASVTLSTGQVPRDNQLVGAWRLAWLERPGQDGKVRRIDCTGLFVFSPDGHASVQVMERNPEMPGRSGPQQYSAAGYEASWGTYTIDESSHTFMFHIEGALVRSLIGNDLPRAYELSGKQLVVKSTRAGLDSGVTPAELSEAVAHLALYSGWSNALSAVPALKEIFAQRGIRANQLPEISPNLLPLDEKAEAERATTVQQNFGAVAPAVVQYTTDLLFRDLWLRPALAPRDRSLITVSALISSGHVAQITYHLNRAMDNGLTREQASKMLTHLAFYAG